MTNQQKSLQPINCINLNHHFPIQKNLILCRKCILLLHAFFIQLFQLIVTLVYLLVGLRDQGAWVWRNLQMFGVVEGQEMLCVFWVHFVLLTNLNIQQLETHSDSIVNVNNIQQQLSMHKQYPTNNNPYKSFLTPPPISSAYPSAPNPHPQPNRVPQNSHYNHNESSMMGRSRMRASRWAEDGHLMTRNIDQVEVDYREKAFQFMSKNTELELNNRQARLDVINLEKEMEKLCEILEEMLGVFGIKGFQDSMGLQNTINRVENPGHQPIRRKGSKYTLQQLQHIKKCLENVLSTTQNPSSFSQKQKPLQFSRMTQTTRKQAPSNYDHNESAFKNLDTERITSKNTNITTNVTSYFRYQAERSDECQCEGLYSEIIKQYKEMIDSQHSNIMKKEKNIKMAKKEVEEYKNIIEELKKNVTRLQRQVQELEAQLSQSKQQQSKISQLDTKLKEIQGQLTQQKNQYEQKLTEKNGQLEEALKDREQLFREKEKLKYKYKQEIVHFQQMEKLVEEKLIEVQYEMNFYKKEREQNFEKIKNLEQQLMEYKAEQQKKYYSFGDQQKDVCLQVQPKDICPQIVESQAQIIISCDKTVTIKNKNKQDLKKEASFENEIPTLQPISSQNPKKDRWTIQCYQQSIKTLLLENARIKNCLLKLYKSKKGASNQKIDQQVQVQIKMLISVTGEVNEQGQFEEQEVKETRKGRKFIKEV